MGVSAAANQNNAGGLAVVWATENTREAIFDAIKRKEVYAHQREAADRALLRQRRCRSISVDSPNAAEAHRRGAPMGGDLGDGGEWPQPRFAVFGGTGPGGTARPCSASRS